MLPCAGCLPSVAADLSSELAFVSAVAERRPHFVMAGRILARVLLAAGRRTRLHENLALALARLTKATMRVLDRVLDKTEGVPPDPGPCIYV